VETIQENIRRVEQARAAKPPEEASTVAQLPNDDPQRPTLSLCMIVRNEEERLGTCLESVSDLVDEIVVVDTGSTDQTVAVAERYGARVGHFPWCDDFSAARNVSIGMASCDWILWLDADDVLPREDIDKIRGLLRKEKDKGYFFVLDSQGYEPVSCLQTRLFPNLPGAQFEYPVHEQITPSLIKLGIGFEATDVRVVHTGYTTPEVVREKQERYLRILERWLEDHPEACIVRSHVAMTYYIWGDLDRSIAEYERILNDSDCRKDRNLVIETTSLLHLGRCWMRKDENERALPHLLDAQKLDDQYAVTNLTLGECYTRMGRSNEALDALERARASEDQVTFASNDPRAPKYSIRFFSGQNLEALGRWSEAADQYRQASDATPTRPAPSGRSRPSTGSLAARTRRSRPWRRPYGVIRTIRSTGSTGGPTTLTRATRTRRSAGSDVPSRSIPTCPSRT
jgi:glycosyltransferase involved in cell wall biosynthesis